MSGDITTIRELVKKRLEHIETINKISAKYLTTIASYISGLNPVEYAQCKEALKQTSSIDEVNEITLPAISKMYDDLQSLEKSVHVLFGMMSNETYMKMALYNMSSTYTINLRNEKAKAFTAFEKYQDASIADDTIIHNIVYDTIGLKDNPEIALMFISDNIDVVNKFTIALVGYVIKYLSGDKRRSLELIVERQKDIVFGHSMQRYTTITMNSLYPITKSMPLSELMSMIGVRATSIDQFAERHNVVYINNGSKSPIEFDMRGLINQEYIIANGLKTTPSTGLTKKIIERFNTAKYLGRGLFATEVTVRGEGPEWYIIETLNGTLFRILGNLSTVNYKTSANTIQSLIGGLSLRPHEYNKLLSESILDNCFDAKAQLVLDSYVEEKKIIKSSDPTKDKVITALMKYFSDNLTITASTTDRTIRDVFKSDAVYDILHTVLPHKTGIHGKGYTEYLVTYNLKFDSLVRKFIKELDRVWDNIITARDKSEREPDALREYIMETVRRLIRRAADALDGDNIWTEYDSSLKEYFLDATQSIV